MNNFISGNNLNVSGEIVVSGDINQDITKQAIFGDIVSESVICNGDFYADNLTIYNDFSVAGQLSTNSILTNNLDTQYIRLNGESIDLSSLSKLTDISGNVKDFIEEKINNLIGGASSQFDTLKEIQTVLENNSNVNNALIQYQNKVDKYDDDGNPKQFVYADKNNSYTGVQNFSGSVVLGLTKNHIGLDQVNNTSDLDKPISNAVFSSLNQKLDKSIYDAGIITKLDTTTYNTFLITNTSNLNNKLDTTTYNTFLTTNISNLNSKLDKSIYDSFISSNASNLTLKLDKSIYDSFIANNQTNLNAKLNASDFFDVIDLKVDKTVFNTYQLSTNNAINTYQTSINNLTGISYNTTNDLTTIDNNVIISSGKNLFLGTTNVGSNLTTLNDTVSGISYNTTGDLTTIDNNLTITTGKNLLLGTTNVLNTLNAINQTLSGITYELINDTTRINNHIIMPLGNNLLFGDLYNVKNKIDEKALIIGNNNFDGTNKFISDSVPLQINTKTNPLLNNSLTFYFANGNGQFNPLVKADDLVLYSGTTTDNAKSNIYIGPWSASRKGIRISSTKFEIGTGIIETPGYYLDGSSSNSVSTFQPQGLNGGLEIYSTNSIDMTLKTKRILTNDSGTHTYGYTSLNNDNLQIFNGNILANKNIVLQKTGLVLANHQNTFSQIYQFNEVLVLDNGSINDSKVNMNVRGLSPGNDTNGNPINGIVKTVMSLSYDKTTINNDLIVNGSLTSTSLNNFPNITDLTIINNQSESTSSGSIHTGLIATVTLNKPLKKQIKFTSPISFYRFVLLAPSPTTTNITAKEIKITISNINIQVRKNGIIEPTTSSSFLFNEQLPQVIIAYKKTNFKPSPTSYNLNYYIGTLNLTHDISGDIGDIFTYFITANIETVSQSDTDVSNVLYTNTVTQTLSNSSLITVEPNFSQFYYSPSYSLAVSKANIQTTGLIQANEISANEIGAKQLNVNDGKFNSIINRGYLTTNYIKSPSNIVGYMFNGNMSSSTPLTPTPFLCSMKYFGPANVDDIYLINAGYKVLLFDGPDYNTWDPTNLNSQLSAYSSFYWEIINDGDVPKVVAVSSTKLNKTESIVVYYRPSIDEPYTLVWLPHLSYTP